MNARALFGIYIVVIVSATMVAADGTSRGQTRTSDAQFRSNVKTVAIHATVHDEDGRLVPGLGIEDFVVLDNGRRVHLTAFSDAPQPITAVVMLDMSFSMEPRFQMVRESVRHFIHALGADDQATLGAFSDEIWVSPLLTSDRHLLNRVIEEELWPGGGATPLWQAVDRAVSALPASDGRRVVVVLTDGTDTGPLRGAQINEATVEQRIRAEGVMFYAVRLKGRWSATDQTLRRLTETTGGGHFQLRTDADLSATFLRFVEELRSQYVLGFMPATLDGKTHRLDVRVQRSALKVRGRRSYLAAPQ